MSNSLLLGCNNSCHKSKSPKKNHPKTFLHKRPKRHQQPRHTCNGLSMDVLEKRVLLLVLQKSIKRFPYIIPTIFLKGEKDVKKELVRKCKGFFKNKWQNEIIYLAFINKK